MSSKKTRKGDIWKRICDCCTGISPGCVNCPHWVGHKIAREQIIEQETEKFANSIADIVRNGIEEALKKTSSENNT